MFKTLKKVGTISVNLVCVRNVDFGSATARIPGVSAYSLTLADALG